MNQITDTETVSVKFVGGNRPIEQVTMTPGVTAGDVLRDLGLANQGFLLARADASDTIAMNESLYSRIENGELLHVSSSMEAGVSA